MKTKVCTKEMVKSRESTDKRPPRGFLGFLITELLKAGNKGMSGKAFVVKAAKRDPNQTPLTIDNKLVRPGQLQSLDNWLSTDVYNRGYGVGAIEKRARNGKLIDKRYYILLKPGDESVLTQEKPVKKAQAPKVESVTTLVASDSPDVS